MAFNPKAPEKTSIDIEGFFKTQEDTGAKILRAGWLEWKRQSLLHVPERICDALRNVVRTHLLCILLGCLSPRLCLEACGGSNDPSLLPKTELFPVASAGHSQPET